MIAPTVTATNALRYLADVAHCPCGAKFVPRSQAERDENLCPACALQARSLEALERIGKGQMTPALQAKANRFHACFTPVPEGVSVEIDYDFGERPEAEGGPRR